MNGIFHIDGGAQDRVALRQMHVCMKGATFEFLNGCLFDKGGGNPGNGNVEHSEYIKLSTKYLYVAYNPGIQKGINSHAVVVLRPWIAGSHVQL